MSEQIGIDTIQDDDLKDEALDRMAGVKFAGCIQSRHSFASTNSTISR